MPVAVVFLVPEKRVEEWVVGKVIVLQVSSNSPIRTARRKANSPRDKSPLSGGGPPGSAPGISGRGYEGRSGSAR